MKIKILPVSTVEVKHASLLSDIEQKLSNFFQSKNYGEDLKEVYIAVIAVKPNLQRFYKDQKPEYISDTKNYVRNTISNSFNRALKYSINLNLELFNNANEAEATEMLKQELLSSMSLFDRFKNKIKDFNVLPFKQDMKFFFEEMNASGSLPA